jgi:hypothetical protein
MNTPSSFFPPNNAFTSLHLSSRNLNPNAECVRPQSGGGKWGWRGARNENGGERERRERDRDRNRERGQQWGVRYDMSSQGEASSKWGDGRRGNGGDMRWSRDKEEKLAREKGNVDEDMKAVDEDTEKDELSEKVIAELQQSGVYDTLRNHIRLALESDEVIIIIF